MSNNYWFEAKNISSFKNNFEVIRNLNLKLKYDENIILIGPNGSGKSSLIELINRNIYPVEQEDSVLKIFSKKLINIWEIRKKISTVNNEIMTRIAPELKVFELIISGLYGKYGQVYNKKDKDIDQAYELINKMSLKKISDIRFSYLSEGEKKITLIARALINNPEILILDEPSANLDIKSKFYLIDKINELSKINTKVLCITHDITLITEIYNRIIMIKDREVIADGKPKEILNSENINKLFDINIELIKHQNNWNIYRKFI